METFSALLCGEFPTQMPVTRSLVFSLICARINSWVNNGDAGDLGRNRAHYDVTVMFTLDYYLRRYVPTDLRQHGTCKHAGKWLAAKYA